MTRDNLKFPDAENPKQGSGNNGDRFGGSRVGKVTCAYCKGKHPAESCKSVSELGARRQHIRKTAKCFNCLMSGHVVNKCRSSLRCAKCGGKHHSSICTSTTLMEDIFSRRYFRGRYFRESRFLKLRISRKIFSRIKDRKSISRKIFSRN